VSAFPWDNLIIAVSTLGAALGSVGLKSRIDRKDRAAQAERDDASARAERQRAAYKALVASATEMLYNYRKRHDNGYTDELSKTQLADLRSRGLAVLGELFGAVADVQLAGSDDARQSAANLRSAALEADAALEYGSQEEAEEPLADYEVSIGAFIDTVRP